MRTYRTLLCILSLSLLLSACGQQGGSSSPSVANRGAVTTADEPASGERYDHVAESAFRVAGREPLSTFSIDVDTASYSNVRRFIEDGHLPPADAVRVEEFVNYFAYEYPQPIAGVPFSVTTEVAECPWNEGNRLMRIGLKGRDVSHEQMAASNLVFLIDTSGSMASSDKLPLLQSSLEVLVDQLTERDRVAIVTYAGSSRLALDATPGDRKDEIKAAIRELGSGGSTNGAAGIEQAYAIAERNAIPGGNNRVVLATDGDFNVGVTSQEALARLVETKRESGVYLTVLGFGTGNLNDATMERLADLGNGNYAYVDSLDEGRRVLGRNMRSTIQTIAKDVKIQVEFNPAAVARYRLVGYENRALADEDFEDDLKDAGEIGAGHTVTALYEIVPARADRGDVATVRLRYKEPNAAESESLSVAVADAGARLEDVSPDFRFASAVAEFGMRLRGSQYVERGGYDDLLARARAASGPDLDGRRAEFLRLVASARSLADGKPSGR
jgi:Ca-activated chloride channel family protein